jgi:citrate lyase subunit beta/citryl-CoA lyase
MESPRNILAVPGSNARMIDKALASDADAIFLDLEDAVAPAEKDAARKLVIEALLRGGWGGKSRTIRINPVDSMHCYRDLVDVIETVGDSLDAIIVPKVDTAGDVTAVATLLGQLEQFTKRNAPVRIEAQIESALGLTNCEAIAASNGRLVSLIFGPGDFASSAAIPADNIGIVDRWDTAYGSHRWHYAMSRIVVAARAYGLRPIDGPYADFHDDSGLMRSSLVARALGFDGKWCIHPGQLPTVARVFSPSATDIERAAEIVSAYERAIAAGQGAVAAGNQMIDAASVQIARKTLQRARELGLA